MSSPAMSLSPMSNGDSPPAILTPSRRVKALLAQFDDSDSDNEVLRPELPSMAESRAPVRRFSGVNSFPRSQSEKNDESEEVEATPLMASRGHFAARLQSRYGAGNDRSSDVREGRGAYNRIKSQVQALEANAGNSITATDVTNASRSEDEIARPVSKRQRLKRKSSPVAEDQHRIASSRSQSPIFSPSFSALKASAKSTQPDEESDSDDLPANPLMSNNSRFLELVEKHRKQRLAQEAADIVKRAARVERLQSLSKPSGRQRGSSPGDGSDEDSDLSNSGVGRKLSKASRPTRKASKKAIEEMNRETQRMTRNMQLAHQAKTKKKITKESLLARFNYPPASVSNIEVEEDHNKTANTSSVATSDVEERRKHDTPPTSPPQLDSTEKDVSFLSLPPAEIFESTKVGLDEHIELHTMDQISTRSPHSIDKGKRTAVEEQFEDSLPPVAVSKERKEFRPIRIKWSKEEAVIARAADSDSDLEIITSQSKSRKFTVFKILPSRKAREKPSHIALRSLAHIMDISDKKRLSMNAAQMEAKLRGAARLQARRQRQEKIEELKAKGVVIQSAEEREKDQQEVEDLVERARQEGAEIQKREKASAKKDGTFIEDGLDDDDSDDEDGDFVNDSDTELQNADDEEEGDGGEDAEDDEGGMALDGLGGELIDPEAQEQTSDEESEQDTDREQLDLLSNDEEEEVASVTNIQRRSRIARVLSDDEDENSMCENGANTLLPVLTKTNEEGAGEQFLPAPAKTPQSASRSARKMIPGLQMSDDLPMGLTQAFAATMAGSQSQDTTSDTQERKSYPIIRERLSPDFPIVPKLRRLESLDVVTDSQPASQTQSLNIDLSFSQSQTVPQSPAGLASTQLSQLAFEPTQDVGFVLSPFVENRFDTPLRVNAPHSTIETVIVPREDERSPLVQRKGRLRRGRVSTISDDEGDVEKGNSAFDVMRRAVARNEAVSFFDKSKSHAKDIVDEAAEESEDEYAGLGGASDDEAGEENEEDRNMIDHDEKIGQGDEAKLAGLFADKERKQDEAAVSKLLKDITTGALRRKRGVGDDLDLSDEEDEAARRREAKRREFARMRRELLKDEAVGKIAEDQKKEAFLRSIEDHEAADDDDDDDVDFDTVELPEEDSQSQQTDHNERDATATASPALALNTNKRKRPLEPSSTDTLNRLPPAVRRTALKVNTVNRKPSTIAEIRESVSFLIEEPDSQSATPQYGSSDDEDEDQDSYLDLNRHLQAADEDEDDGEDLGDFIVDDSQDSDIFKKPQLPPSRAPFAERRTKVNIVDRRSLLRQASSSSSTTSVISKMAFFTSKAGSGESFAFKVPSLLRRATTNSSFGSSSNVNVSATGVSVATERGAPDQEKEVIRKGAGGRRNAVNFRMNPKEEQMKSRVTAKKGKTAKAGGKGFLGVLFSGNSWE